MSDAGPRTPRKPAASPPWQRERLFFLVGLYAAFLSAGPFPWSAAYHGARSPTDLTRDYVAAAALARGERLSTLDGARGNAEAERIGSEAVIILGNSPFHLHPPPASLPMRLLVPLGFRGASIAWLGISLALLAILARVLVATIGRVTGSAFVSPTVLFVVLIMWPPTLTNLQLGQWSIALATLIALGFRAWDSGRRLRGAAWLAVAAALKLTPLGLLPFVALRERRAGALFVGVLLALFVVALPAGGGLDAWMAFLRDGGTNVAQWQTWSHNTLSIHGFVARLFVGARFARPLVYAPTLAHVLIAAAGLALVGLALRATWRRGSARGPASEGCVFALWNVLVVVLNPLAWTHYALLLLLPAALVVRFANDPASLVDAAARVRLRRAVAVALVVLTIPKETGALIARPWPSSPATAPLLSAHLFAALLIFWAALRAVRLATEDLPVVPPGPVHL